VAQAAHSGPVPLQPSSALFPPRGVHLVSGPAATGTTAPESTNQPVLMGLHSGVGRPESSREVSILYHNLQEHHLAFFKKQEHGRSRLDRETHVPITDVLALEGSFWKDGLS